MARFTLQAAFHQRGFLAGALGLACCLAVRDMPQFFAFDAINDVSSTQYLLAAGRGALFVLALVALRAAGLEKLGGSASRARFAPATLGALLASAGLAIVGFSESGEALAWGCFLLGFGQSAFIFSWALRLLELPRRTMFYTLVVALMAAGAMEALLALMLPGAEKAITMILPFASWALQTRLLQHPTDDPRSSDTEYAASIPDRPFMLDGKLAATVLTFAGYSFIARQLTDTWMSHGNAGNLFLFQVFGSLGTALSAVFVLFIFRLRKPYKTPAVYSAFVVPLLLATLYLSTFLTGVLSIFYVVPLFIFRKMILFLAIAGALTHRAPLDRMRFFCSCFLFVELGNLCQTWFFELVRELSFPSDIVSYSVVFAIMTFIVVSELSSFFTGSIPSNAREAAPSEAELAEIRRGAAVEHLRATCGLTGREAEVLRLLALGRNADYIAKNLFIAHSTAKSHIAHIYQKTGLNSQQRLMDAIEQFDPGECRQL